jgi:4-aminobutyrate aminotransferase-like enzyme
LFPDFVTLGKSMGNGFPVAALISRKEITRKFDEDGIEYFNTYGGNPVSCRAALAVLDVIEDEQLQEHALRVGSYLLAKLKLLSEASQWIGDVRGRGLFIGIEIVRDRERREPGIEEAKAIRSK